MKTILLCLVLVCACSSTVSAPDAGAPPGEPQNDEATRASLIKTDCAHLVAMGCQGGKATPDGHSCAEREAAEVDAGVPPSWTCRAKASSCAQVDACK